MRRPAMETTAMRALFVAALLILGPGAQASAPETDSSRDNTLGTRLEVNVKDSQVEWIGRKIIGQHNGTLQLGSGYLLVHEGKVLEGSFAVDMTTLTNLDLEDGSLKKTLENHLRSDDFFSIDKYPVSRFKIGKVTPIPAARPGEPNHIVEGVLQIKNIANRIEFPAYIDVREGQLSANAEIDVDRTRWDIRYGSGKFFQGLGDRLIRDHFTLKITLTAGNR